MDIYNPEGFFRDFPRLHRYIQVSSQYTDRYNCIAWAVGVDNRCWWPNNPDMYWPPECPEEEATISAFISMFATLGYEPCDDGRLENDFEKIALYADGDEPTHAARQLQDGRWSSKCGGNVDIEHELQDLEGPCYGRAVMFFHRLKKLL